MASARAHFYEKTAAAPPTQIFIRGKLIMLRSSLVVPSHYRAHRAHRAVRVRNPGSPGGFGTNVTLINMVNSPGAGNGKRGAGRRVPASVSDFVFSCRSQVTPFARSPRPWFGCPLACLLWLSGPKTPPCPHCGTI